MRLLTYGEMQDFNVLIISNTGIVVRKRHWAFSCRLPVSCCQLKADLKLETFKLVTGNRRLRTSSSTPQHKKMDGKDRYDIWYPGCN